MAWQDTFGPLVKLWHDFWFYTSFAFVLINTFGAGTRWIARTFRLLLFVMILFVPMMRKLGGYFTNKRIIHQVSYGPKKRNSADVYLVPREKKDDTRQLVPVVVYVGGGGWTVGYRMWALVMAEIFSGNGILLISLDYRNFPQGTVSDMLTDINMGLTWVFENVSQYDGDPNNVHLMGQSAGAHLVLLAAVDQAARETHMIARAKGLPCSLSSNDLPSLNSKLVSMSDSSDSDAVAAHDRGEGTHLPKRILRPSEMETLNALSKVDCNTCDSEIVIDPPVHPRRKNKCKSASSSPIGRAPDTNHLLTPTRGHHRHASLTSKEALERSLQLSYSVPPSSWKLENIRSIIALSGPYDISVLIPHLHIRGLYKQVMYCIMEGEMTHNSPCARIQKRSFKECNAGKLLPPIYLLHGKADETIPFQESIRMKQALEEVGADVTLKLYKGRNHTDAVLEDMFSGDNPMLKDVVLCVKSGGEGLKHGDSEDVQEPEAQVGSWRLIMARYVNPF